MLKILNMLLTAAVLGAVAFSARQTDMLGAVRKELQKGPVKKNPVKSKSGFEYLEFDELHKGPVPKKSVKPKPEFKYHKKQKIDYSKIASQERIEN